MALRSFASRDASSHDGFVGVCVVSKERGDTYTGIRGYVTYWKEGGALERVHPPRQNAMRFCFFC